MGSGGGRGGGAGCGAGCGGGGGGVGGGGRCSFVHHSLQIQRSIMLTCNIYCKEPALPSPPTAPPVVVAVESCVLAVSKSSIRNS